MHLNEPAEEIEQDNERNEEDVRREKRIDQWGQQYDIWLIRRARKGKEIDLMLSLDWPGVTKKNCVTVCPIRIDKDAIQVKAGDSEPFWVMKSFIVGFKEVPNTNLPATT